MPQKNESSAFIHMHERGAPLFVGVLDCSREFFDVAFGGPDMVTSRQPQFALEEWCPTSSDDVPDLAMSGMPRHVKDRIRRKQCRKSTKIRQEIYMLRRLPP
jgi:hypothetical protein